MSNGEKWLMNHRQTDLRSGPDAGAAWLAKLPQWSVFRQAGDQQGFRVPVHYFGSSLTDAGDGWVDAVDLGPVDQPAQVPPTEPGWTAPPGGGGRWLMNHRRTELRAGPSDDAVAFTTVPQWSIFAQLAPQKGAYAPVYYFGNSTSQAGIAWAAVANLGPIDEPAHLPPVEPDEPVPTDRPKLHELTNAPNFQFSFEDLWPQIQASSAKYGAEAQVVTAIIYQESGFKNWLVHRDGTGHGLPGLDDNGLLPDFEHWSGLHFGRGRNAGSIPPDLQIEYLARTLASFARTYGSSMNGARVWHRGPVLWRDSRGQNYEDLIRAHINRFFP